MSLLQTQICFGKIVSSLSRLLCIDRLANVKGHGLVLALTLVNAESKSIHTAQDRLQAFLSFVLIGQNLILALSCILAI